MSDLGPLSSYGEYIEENKAIAERKKNIFVPENQLSEEISPYLLQHKDSTVGWYAWGDEAFNIARREDKPIFLSIGYSTSHWCSVMDKECFNDPEVAEMLNDTCIPVKVDREERPDLDALFMEVCIAQNGSGGWPLNIFLTPEGLPFFCTTWLPKRTRGQMPGMTDILPRVKWLWLMQREDIDRTAEELTKQVKERFNIFAGSKFGGKIGSIPAHEAFINLRNNFDVQWGGFGKSPKYPDFTKLLFLLRFADEKSGFHTTGYERYDAFTMVDITLRRMWRGGIHDHLGGGFSVYSVDSHWLVPHFEKFLCDQAMLLLISSIAQDLKGSPFHHLMAEDIVFCIKRDFCNDESYSQGFRSAIGGDTDEGEGRYYLWTEDEIRNILHENTGLFCTAYAVLPSGNFAGELAGSHIGCNILYEASTVTELARRYGIKGSEVGYKLSECRKLLLNARDKRVSGFRDDKVLTDWNGLIIGALAKASVSFNKSEWKDIAERTALFIQRNLRVKEKFFHVWTSGNVTVEAMAGDYAELLWGLMELYKACKNFNTGEKQLNDILKFAQETADEMINKFYDEKSGGINLIPENSPNIFTSFRSAADRYLPSVNAFAVVGLNELGQILDEKKYSDYAKKIIECFARIALEVPIKYLSLMVAESLWKPVKPKKIIAQPVKIPTNEELDNENNLNIQEQGNSENNNESKNISSRRTRPERSARVARSHRASRTRK